MMARPSNRRARLCRVTGDGRIDVDDRSILRGFVAFYSTLFCMSINDKGIKN